MCSTKRDRGLRTETYHVSLCNFKSPLSDFPATIYQSRDWLFCCTTTNVTVKNQRENMRLQICMFEGGVHSVEHLQTLSLAVRLAGCKCMYVSWSVIP